MLKIINNIANNCNTNVDNEDCGYFSRANYLLELNHSTAGTENKKEIT